MVLLAGIYYPSRVYEREFRTMPKTRIVATLGPASDSYAVLRKMYTAGLDVVRLNSSHGDHKQHRDSIELVRRIQYRLTTRVTWGG